MKDALVPVEYAWFEQIARGHTHTGADFIPLTMSFDIVDANYFQTAIHHHDFLSIYVARRGRGTHMIDGVPYGIARGDVYVMGPGMTHYFADYDDLVLDTLHFSPLIFDNATWETLDTTPGFRALFVEEALGRNTGGRRFHLTPDAHARVDETLSEMRTEWLSATPTGALLTRGLLLRLLVHLARHYAAAPSAALDSTPSPSAVRESTIAAAIDKMDQHFTEPLRIEQVAAAVFLSPDRFTEVFSATMGRTPRDYLRHLRVERAKSLLTSTDEPVAEVGLQAGFGEPAYFARVFRAETGMSPRDYRRRNRALKFRK